MHLERRLHMLIAAPTQIRKDLPATENAFAWNFTEPIGRKERLPRVTSPLLCSPPPASRNRLHVEMSTSFPDKALKNLGECFLVKPLIAAHQNTCNNAKDLSNTPRSTRGGKTATQTEHGVGCFRCKQFFQRRGLPPNTK